MDLSKLYSIRGIVVKGSGRGKKLGIPTANLRYRKIPKPFGIYSSVVKFNNKLYKGALHIGPIPSFSSLKPRIEVNIIGLKKNIRGKRIMIYPMKRIRGIKKYSTIEDLRKQIRKDIRKVRSEINLEKFTS